MHNDSAMHSAYKQTRKPTLRTDAQEDWLITAAQCIPLTSSVKKTNTEDQCTRPLAQNDAQLIPLMNGQENDQHTGPQVDNDTAILSTYEWTTKPNTED